MNMLLSSRIWWENKFKYWPLLQRIFLLRKLSTKFPATINIEPTNICNLYCRFCPARQTNRAKGTMSWRLYQKIIDQIKNHHRKLVVLWLNKDGEPLIHPKISQMIAYAKKRRVAERIEMYTNGVLLTETVAQKLIVSQLDSLVISIDAIDKESYRRIKKQGFFIRVVNNVVNLMKLKRQLKSSKPIVSVKMIDMGNKKTIETFRKFWQGKVDNVVIQSLHEWEGSISNRQEARSNKQKTINNQQLTINNSQFRYPCNLPWLSMAVSWNGEVSPCCVNYLQNELVMGNLSQQNIKEIWQGEKWQQLRKAHVMQDFSDFPTCKSCSFWQQLPGMRRYIKVL